MFVFRHNPQLKNTIRFTNLNNHTLVDNESFKQLISSNYTYERANIYLHIVRLSHPWKMFNCSKMYPEWVINFYCLFFFFILNFTHIIFSSFHFITTQSSKYLTVEKQNYIPQKMFFYSKVQLLSLNIFLFFIMLSLFHSADHVRFFFIILFSLSSNILHANKREKKKSS